MENEFNLEIEIINKGDRYIPIVVDGVSLTSNNKGMPSELNFTVIKDENLNFTEGNEVYLKFNGEIMFSGIVFVKERADKYKISVKAYDQLRYLQCKDSIEFPDMKASEYIKFIADKSKLECGELEDTEILLPSIVEDRSSYIDMILNALDSTRKSNSREYVLYDDCFKLTLKSTSSLKSECYININNIGGYSYTTSIDKETYTKVRVVKSNGSDEDIECVSQNEEAINKWGVLSYYEQLRDEDNLKARADEILNQYCNKTINLSLKNVIGCTDVRGGSNVFVKLDLGDMSIEQYLTVTRCVHNFQKGTHTMTLDVKGGVIDE